MNQFRRLSDDSFLSASDSVLEPAAFPGKVFVIAIDFQLFIHAGESSIRTFTVFAIAVSLIQPLHLDYLFVYELNR